MFFKINALKNFAILRIKKRLFFYVTLITSYFLPVIIAKFLRTAFSQNNFRSSPLQMFFKIGALKSFPNFTGKHLCWSLFKKLAGWKLATLLKKLQHWCFYFCKIFDNTFFTGHLQWLLLPSGGCSVFFFKSNKTSISQPCYDVLIIFSSQHIVWCKKSPTRLFINSPSIVRFSK